jgi:uncharacterized protein YlxP (DUF503 family)
LSLLDVGETYRASMSYFPTKNTKQKRSITKQNKKQTNQKQKFNISHIVLNGVAY